MNKDLTKHAMINRRAFISATLLSSLTLLKVKAFSTSVFLKSNIDQFIENIGAKVEKRALLQDKQLMQLSHDAFKKWHAIGYKHFKDSYYLLSSRGLYFFPIELYHKSLGQVDFALLIFEKDDFGGWFNHKPINGFQIKELNNAVDDLAEKVSINSIQEYILPVIKTGSQDSYAYSTKKGKVRSIARVINNQTYLETEIWVDDKPIWQKNAHA